LNEVAGAAPQPLPRSLQSDWMLWFGILNHMPVNAINLQVAIASDANTLDVASAFRA
jgi:hypothetical protein